MTSFVQRVFLSVAVLVTASAAQVQAADIQKVSSPGRYEGYSPLLYSESKTTSSYFKARDGVRLAMDIHRPAVNGKVVETPYPVVWQHAASRRVAPDQRYSAVRQMPELVKYGYVVVEVDRRGMGASFGTRRGYNDRTEARDAYDITEWLATQSWSTGKVGVYGCSNTGDAAMHSISKIPPHLSAVFAGCFSWIKYDGFLRGGIFANWGSGVERSFEEDMLNPPVDGDEDKKLLRQAVEEHRDNTPLATLWRGMPFRDSWSDLVNARFWGEGSAGNARDAVARSKVPLYVFGGWFDDFRREGLVAYAGLPNNPRKILIGPWEHCRNPDFYLLGEAHRFFDHWLKGIDNGVMAEPPITYATQASDGSVVWKQAKEWPGARRSYVTQYLNVSSAGADQTLTTKAVTAKSKSVLLDVKKPIACPAGWNPQANACMQSDNGIRFEGPKLSADTEVTGHPLVQLWLASNNPDQNVFAYLEDVAPDGKAQMVTEGRLKLRLRAEHKPPYEFLGLPWHRSLEADDQPLYTDEVVKAKFDMLPASHVFQKGHHWRLTVTGSDPRERAVPPAGTYLRIVSDAQKPSVFELPVGALQTSQVLAVQSKKP